MGPGYQIGVVHNRFNGLLISNVNEVGIMCSIVIIVFINMLGERWWWRGCGRSHNVGLTIVPLLWLLSLQEQCSQSGLNSLQIRLWLHVLGPIKEVFLQSDNQEEVLEKLIGDIT